MSDLMMTNFHSERTALRQVFPSLRLMLRAYLTRRDLLDLTPSQRIDIGISTSAALAEAARLPWDINQTRGRPATTPLNTIQAALKRARMRHLAAQLKQHQPDWYSQADKIAR